MLDNKIKECRRKEDYYFRKDFYHEIDGLDKKTVNKVLSNFYNPYRKEEDKALKELVPDSLIALDEEYDYYNNELNYNYVLTNLTRTMVELALSLVVFIHFNIIGLSWIDLIYLKYVLLAISVIFFISRIVITKIGLKYEKIWRYSCLVDNPKWSDKILNSNLFTKEELEYVNGYIHFLKDISLEILDDIKKEKETIQQYIVEKGVKYTDTLSYSENLNIKSELEGYIKVVRYPEYYYREASTNSKKIIYNDKETIVIEKVNSNGFNYENYIVEVDDSLDIDSSKIPLEYYSVDGFIVNKKIIINSEILKQITSSRNTLNLVNHMYSKEQTL